MDAPPRPAQLRPSKLPTRRGLVGWTAAAALRLQVGWRGWTARPPRTAELNYELRRHAVQLLAARSMQPRPRTYGTKSRRMQTFIHPPDNFSPPRKLPSRKSTPEIPSS